jgi:peptidoglycan/LPS O-acetylase OafA/YrhL
VWSHAFTLGGFGVDPLRAFTRGAEDVGAIAVDGFFVLSGLLIVRSFERTANIGRFLWHRSLRIFPGFWACLAAVAFVFAPILFVHERGTLAGYFSSPNSPWTYLTANAFLAMNQYNVAGLLAKTPVPFLFNRSLWTLQYEFYCYIAVAVLGAFAIVGRRRSILLVPLSIAFALFIAGSVVRGQQTVPTTLRSMELYTFFGIGASAYLYRSRIPMRGSIAALALLLIAATLPTRIYGVVLPLALGYLTLYAAMMLPLRDFDKRSDFSYGIYIYAFPISQLLTAFGATAAGFAAYFGAAYAISLAFAVASWFGIEKRALALKNLSLKAFLSGRMEDETRDAQISHGIGSARGI